MKIIEIPKEHGIFKSKIDRFEKKQFDLNPGPGSYINERKTKYK